MVEDELNIRERRKALNMSQKELAEKVRKRSGKSFSQQALQKLEANPRSSSRLMHFILDVLAREEGGDEREAVKHQIDQLSDDKLALVKGLVEGLLKSNGSHPE